MNTTSPVISSPTTRSNRTNSLSSGLSPSRQSSRKRRTSVAVVFGGGGSLMEKKESVPKVLAEEILKDSSHHGMISKQGGKVKTWKRRLVIVHQGNLYYYAKKTDKQPKGMIRLHGLLCEHVPENDAVISRPFGIKIVSPSRTFYFSCESQQEADRWLVALKEAAVYVSHNATHVMSAVMGSSDSDTKFRTLDHLMGDSNVTICDGDVIALRPGNYVHDDLDRPLSIQCSLQMRGVGNNEKDYLIMANGSQSPSLFDVECTQQRSAVKISYLTFRSSNFDSVFHVRRGILELDGCHFPSLSHSVLRISGDARVVVYDCNFNGRSALGQPVIIVEDNASATICQCTFDTISHSAIVVRGHATAKISETLFTKCVRGVVIETDNEEDPVAIHKCHFGAHDNAIVVRSTSESVQHYSNQYE